MQKKRVRINLEKLHRQCVYSTHGKLQLKRKIDHFLSGTVAGEVDWALSVLVMRPMAAQTGELTYDPNITQH